MGISLHFHRPTVRKNNGLRGRGNQALRNPCSFFDSVFEVSVSRVLANDQYTALGNDQAFARYEEDCSHLPLPSGNRTINSERLDSQQRKLFPLLLAERENLFGDPLEYSLSFAVGAETFIYVQ